MSCSLRAQSRSLQPSKSCLATSRRTPPVRSGGHNPTKGYASVENGIVIDLKHFNAVALSEDQTQINIGPAARWIDVYTKLDALGLSVAGGRASTVGVGGLLLGGGLSFHSPQVGFAYDNVISFEIVLADGRIVTADAQNNADLAIVFEVVATTLAL